MSRRDLVFVLFSGILVLVFWGEVEQLASYAWANSDHSHALLIPVVSAYFLYAKRKLVAESAQLSLLAGVPVLSLGLALIVAATHLTTLSGADRLSLVACALVTLWIGAFLLIYGCRAARAVIFPLLFMFFIAPIPQAPLHEIVRFLQTTSAWTAYAILQLIGVPVEKDGLSLILPRMQVEVAEECSGIRSSLCLLLAGIVMGQMWLGSGWNRIALLVVVVPVAIFKNGLRIATLCFLTAYVDESFMESGLHTSGGILFFLISLVIIVATCRALQRREEDWSARRNQGLVVEP